MTQTTTLPVPAGPGDRTQAVQRAFDLVEKSGGGIVVLEAGVHLCRGLRLRSNVEVRLAEGAVLRAAADYDAFADNVCSVVAEESDRAFLLANGAENVTISGPGLIDGQGRRWTLGPDGDMGVQIPAKHRPRLLVIENSRNTLLRDFSILRSAMWTIHLVDDRDVWIEGIEVDNDLDHPNTDGVVIDRCQDVTIQGCQIRTADDGIVLKTSRDAKGGIRPTERVRVAHSTIQSNSCALKLGTESFGDFTDIVFEDCVVRDSNRALGIFSRDGGAVRGVRFRRIDVTCHETPDGFWGSGEAVTINAIDRRPSERAAGAIEDVVIEDIAGTMQGAINLVGRSPSPVRNVILRNVHLHQQPGALGTARSIDLRPTPADLAPAATATGRANAWVKGEDGQVLGLVAYPGGMPGVYAENIGGLTLSNVTIERPDPLPDGWNDRSIVETAA